MINFDDHQFPLQQPPLTTNSESQLQYHLHVSDFELRQPPPTTNSSKNHIWWSTSTNTFVRLTPKTNSVLWQPPPMTNSCDQLQYQLHATYFGLENHLRLQTSVKIIFDNQLQQPPPTIIRPMIIKVCCRVVDYISNSILSTLSAIFICRKL